MSGIKYFICIVDTRLYNTLKIYIELLTNHTDSTAAKATILTSLLVEEISLKTYAGWRRYA